MKITCTQENLSKGLNLVAHIANKNAGLPILNNVLLKSSDKILKLYTSNLDIGITSLVRGKIEEECEFAAEAKTLADYVNLLPKGNIEITITDGKLQISCDNYNTEIKGNSASEFPVIPNVEKKDGYTISAAILKEALQQVIIAASISDLRPEISGILFSFGDHELVLAATDSYRLAEKVIPCKQISPDSENKKNSVIVPLKTAQETLRILSLADDVLNDDSDQGSEVKFYIEDNQILLSDNNTELVSKLVEGQYPDYKQIIPQDFRTNIIINKDELQKAIKAASLFTRADVYDILFKINVDKGELEIFAENSQIGKNSIKINTQISGENNDMVLNFKYLLDGLQNINTEQVAIDIVDNVVPCVIRPYKDESIDKNYLYLVMPIRQ